MLCLDSDNKGFCRNGTSSCSFAGDTVDVVQGVARVDDYVGSGGGVEGRFPPPPQLTCV